MIATMIVEDSGMMAMGIGMTIKMGMAVFGISSLLRLMAYDAANTQAVNADGTNSPADVNAAEDIMSAVKLEMALTTAHEAMARLSLMKMADGMGKGKGKKGGRKGDKDVSIPLAKKTEVE